MLPQFKIGPSPLNNTDGRPGDQYTDHHLDRDNEHHRRGSDDHTYYRASKP
ncbi:hypothetical protein BGZ92_010238, partial [Podila epicladia]